MIDHVSLRVRDLGRSKAFYAQALAPLGAAVQMEFEGGAGIGRPGMPAFWLGQGEPPAPMHLAFSAQDRAAVDAFYQAALAAGARDNGPPGLRVNYSPTYYAAFVIDPDGHNIEAVCHAAPAPSKRQAKGAPTKRASRRAAPKRRESRPRSSKRKR